MAHSVFISYARRTSREAAQALHLALGDDAFLDSSDIEDGEQFPRAIIEALLASRVVVVLADEVYFTRWYCLRELRTALAPYDVLLRTPGSTSEQLSEALRHIVIALPAGGRPAGLDNLPPDLRVTDWPRADETQRLVALIRARLGGTSLGERLGAAGGSRILETLVEEAALPPPGHLAGVPAYHPKGQMEVSIGERFVGRAHDVARIHFTLSTMRGDAARSAALSGTVSAAGGFGKTRIAIEYLHRYGPSYHPGGLFWINADVDQGALEEQFYGILRALGAVSLELPVLRQQGADLRGLLSTALRELPADKPVLFVVDNVPESASGAAARSLGEYCPALGISTVLATSRQRTVEAGVAALPLDVLPRSASVALLTHGLARPDSLRREQWEKLAEWVGDLPLVLDLLNRVLSFDPDSAPKLLDMAERSAPLTAELDGLSEALRGQVPEGAIRGITEALSISWKMLGPKGRRAARLLAQLAPEPIPEEVLAAFGLSVDNPKARQALGGRHFVTGGGGGMFGSMHRVIADFIRTAMLQNQTADLLAACRAVRAVMDEERCQNPKYWPLMNTCRPHAEWLHARGLREAPDDTEVAGVVLVLGSAAGILRWARGDLGGARPLQEQVLGASRRVLGEEHALTLWATANLAGTLWRQGDLAGARRLMEQVLEARRRMLGEESSDTLTAMGNLAITLKQQGDLAGARRLEEEVLEAKRRVRGEEHPDTLRAMSNLASTRWHQGDLAGARLLQEQVLEAMPRVLGEEHPATLMAMHNLALTLERQGDLAGARRLQERALEAMRRVLGEEHPDTLRVMIAFRRLHPPQQV
jgi:tetratricopeptide (TPR) repeat protein